MFPEDMNKQGTKGQKGEVHEEANRSLRGMGGGGLEALGPTNQYQMTKQTQVQTLVKMNTSPPVFMTDQPLLNNLVQIMDDVLSSLFIVQI